MPCHQAASREASTGSTPPHEPLSAQFSCRGTHAFGVAETIELSRALGRLPLRLIGYGIEGRSFGPGAGLSPDARRAVSITSARLLKEVIG